jgi:succinyl-diaminopimelate desuccinylase
MKGPIASFICAIIQDFIKIEEEMKISNLGIVCTFTVDEETGCTGVNHLDSPAILSIFQRVKYCILAEPTHLSPVYAHKGISWFKIIFHGKAAHASVPYMGENAILKANRFINLLDKRIHELSSQKSILGNPTINIGTISGGTAPNIVADYCELIIDRRYLENEEPEKELTALKELTDQVDPTAKIIVLASGKAYFLPDGTNNAIYKRVAKSCQHFSHSILPAYTEADLYFRKYHIPTIILGPGRIEQAHQTPEFIEIEMLTDAIKIYQNIIHEFLTKK